MNEEDRAQNAFFSHGWNSVSLQLHKIRKMNNCNKGNPNVIFHFKELGLCTATQCKYI